MPRWLTYRRHATAILLAALILRCLAGVWWQSRLPAEQPFFFGDSETYWSLGQSVAQGEGYRYGPQEWRIFRAPGYPLLLAAMFTTTGVDVSPLAGRMLSAVFGTLTVGGLIWLGSRAWIPETGLIAGWVSAVYPETVAMGAFVLSEAPFSAMLVAQWICSWKAWSANTKSSQMSWGFATGLAAAGGTLIRPSWLLYLPMACLVGWMLSRRTSSTRIGGMAILGLVVGMAPWWIRNHAVSDHFVPTTLQVGASLYDGLSPDADGGSEMSFVPSFLAEEMAAREQAEVPPDSSTLEYDLDQRLRGAALAWARQQPLRVAELVGIKFLRMWNPWPNEAGLRGGGLGWIVALCFLPVFVAGLWGIWRYRHAGWFARQLWLPAVYLTLLHVIFVSSIRYRGPAMWGWILLGAAAIAGRETDDTSAETDTAKGRRDVA